MDALTDSGVALDALTGLPNRGSFERTLSGLSCVIPRRWGLFIVDRVFDRAELRLGDRRPQVVRIRRLQGAAR